MHCVLPWLARIAGTAISSTLVGGSVLFLLMRHMMLQMTELAQRGGSFNPESLSGPGFTFYLQLLIFLPIAGFASAAVLRACDRITSRSSGGMAALATWVGMVVALWAMSGSLEEVLDAIGIPLVLAIPLMMWGGRIAGGVLEGIDDTPIYFDEDDSPMPTDTGAGGTCWAIGIGLLTIALLTTASLLLGVGVVRVSRWLAHNPWIPIFVAHGFATWVGMRFIRCAGWRLPLKKTLGIGAAVISIECGCWIAYLAIQGLPIQGFTSELHWVLMLVVCGMVGAWLGTLGPTPQTLPGVEGDEFQIDYQAKHAGGSRFGEDHPSLAQASSPGGMGNLHWDAGESAGQIAGQRAAPAGGTLGLDRGGAGAPAQSSSPSAAEPPEEPPGSTPQGTQRRERQGRGDLSGLADMYPTIDGNRPRGAGIPNQP